MEKTPSGKLVEELRQLYKSGCPSVLDPDFGLNVQQALQQVREHYFPRGQELIQPWQFTGERVLHQLDLGDRLGADVFFENYREMLKLELCSAVLRPGDEVIDVGANFGFFTLRAAERLASDGKVWAFEPDPRPRASLLAGRRQGGFESIVEISDACVGDMDGPVKFYSAAESSFSGLASNDRSRLQQERRVESVRLDTFAQAHGVGPVRLLKIDVEGFEHAVLAGAHELLARSPDALVVFEVSYKNLQDGQADRLMEVMRRYRDEGWVQYQQAVPYGGFEELVDLEELRTHSDDVFMWRAASGWKDRLSQTFVQMMRQSIVPTIARLFDQNDDSSARLADLLFSSFLLTVGHDFHRQRDLVVNDVRSQAKEQNARLNAEIARLRQELAKLRPDSGNGGGPPGKD